MTKALLAAIALLVPVSLAGALLRPEALLLLLLIPVLAVAAVLVRRSHRYGLHGGLLFVQRGFWDRKLWIAPVARVQSLSVRRSWLQRRLRLSTLVIDTAGAPALAGVRIVDLSAETADGLATTLSKNRSG